jgi:hypothetical protein
MLVFTRTQLPEIVSGKELLSGQDPIVEVPQYHKGPSDKIVLPTSQRRTED